MTRALLVLTVFAALALPATALAANNYTLADDAAGTLEIGPGDRPSIAVRYTAVCLPFACHTFETVSSADDATPFVNTSGLCADSTSGSTAVAFSCNPAQARTQVTGTPNDDAVDAVCEGVRSALAFDAGAGDDVVTGGGCTGSQVDLGPGDDRAVVNGTVNGGPGRDVLIPGPGVGPNTILGGDGVDTVSYENRTANLPVTITLNNATDDGQQGLDLVAADVENATGGAGNDTIIGNDGPNELQGGPGNDVIDGRGGLDFIDAGAGDDRVLARDGAPDRVACGDGNDTAIVDAFDSVDGCETVDSSRALMPDVDGDGVTAPLDCDDHNAGRRPGLFDKPGNKIDEDCSGKDAPFARILSSVQTLFTFGSVTRFPQVKVRGVPEHSTVTLRCGGGRKKGCFKGVKRFRFPRGKDTANVGRPVRRVRFRPGSTFEIRITAPLSIGKVVRLEIRNHKAPRQRVLCLPPGRKSPTRC
jgi:RTX calcium-binding nonapeptide repeat (4 copies)